MKKTIWKYKLKIVGAQEIEMPVGSEILSVQTQNGEPCLWALVNPNEKNTNIRTIETIGTGNPVEGEPGIETKFIDIYQVRTSVFHVFEIIPTNEQEERIRPEKSKPKEFYTTHEISKEYEALSLEKRVGILYEAIDIMHQFNGRSRFACITMAMGYENPEGGSDTYIKK